MKIIVLVPTADRTIITLTSTVVPNRNFLQVSDTCMVVHWFGLIICIK